MTNATTDTKTDAPNYNVEIAADELLSDLATKAAEYGEEYEEKRQWWTGSFDDRREWLDAKYWMLEARGGQRAYSEALAKLQPGGRCRNDDGTVDVRNFMRYLSRAADDCHDRSSGGYQNTRQADEGETANAKMLSLLRDEYGVGWPRFDDLGGVLDEDMP